MQRSLSQTSSGNGGLGLLFASLVCLVIFGGCSRTKYRRAADLESYRLIESRQSNPLWDVPGRRVEPNSSSRMYVGAELDQGSKPLDDAAARRYMNCPDGFDNTRYYSQIPTRGNNENPTWLESLPRDEQDQILLTQPLAMDLALLHSRDYQSRFENVYLTALDLSGNRFEFDMQWFGGLGTDFTATGSDLGDRRSLDVTLDRLGFTKNLAGGGQFATSVLNGLVWDFGSESVQGASAALVTTFTQPLLRGAFRHVRLENLTQAERNMLYSVRDFARFRRLFYVDVATNYLDLLSQAQAIRNLRTNVENLRQNLVEHDFYVRLELVSQIQRDQVFQQYQNGRLSLLAAEQNFAAAMDAFKFQLGLPAWLPFDIDETLLEQFELYDPAVVELQDAAQELFVSLMQFLPPEEATRDFLLVGFERYKSLREQVAEKLPAIESELSSWLSRLENMDIETLGPDDRLDVEQQRSLAERVITSLSEIHTALETRSADYAVLEAAISQEPDPAAVNKLPEGEQDPRSSLDDLLEAATRGDLNLDEILSRGSSNPKLLAWEALQQAVGTQLRSEIAELYIAQTQIRLHLIDIDPLPQLQPQPTISFAFRNRLDLMNSQATVVDAFRKVEVAADALQSNLSVTGGVAIGNDPSKNGPFRFDSSANRYTVGAQFDGPLNRLNERNAYRAAQITYQQAGRSFTANKDQVANELRSILRQLELSRLNFQIARQQVVAATRQVDQAQIDLRSSSQAESNLTLFLLQALQGVLDAKNNLVSNWIAYREQKLRLFAALEMLYLDENGQWINEETGIDELLRSVVVDEEYFPPSWNPRNSADGKLLQGENIAGENVEPAALTDVTGMGGELPSPGPVSDENWGQAKAGVVIPSAPYDLPLGAAQPR